MASAVWKGHISFGLVQIPVELRSATRDQDLDFDLLDRRDMAHVGYRRVNKRTGEEVPAEEIVKGYEYEAGQYVIVDDADFKAANVEATQSVDIVSFVDGAAIDPRYMVRPYYLVPGKRSAKPYALLREVMKRTGRVGIAHVVLRSRQYVAALLVQGPMLVLELLRYAPEVLDPATYDLPGEDLGKVGVTARELEMAEQLVNGLLDEWDPASHRDAYRDDLIALIEAKAKKGGVRPVAQAATDSNEGAEVIDIMELLKRSLASGARPTPKVGKSPKPAGAASGRSRKPG